MFDNILANNGEAIEIPLNEFRKISLFLLFRDVRTFLRGWKNFSFLIFVCWFFVLSVIQHNNSVIRLAHKPQNVGFRSNF